MTNKLLLLTSHEIYILNMVVLKLQQ